MPTDEFIEIMLMAALPWAPVYLFIAGLWLMGAFK